MKQHTSWEKVHKWYSSSTKGRGSYFHEHVVIPGAKRLLGINGASSLLDIGCGSGVLGRSVSPDITYTGIDISPGLIDDAKRQDEHPLHTYIVSDATRPLTLPYTFTHAAFILSLQNIKDARAAMVETSRHLLEGGIVVIVLNHPCFRIPRQSSWGIDEQNKLQYRRILRYLSPMEIPITMHPGKPNSKVTWSYHLSLSSYARILKDSGFLIDTLEEWSSDKMSKGNAAKMENRARNEIPLFLAIKAIKLQAPLSPPPRQ